MNLNLYNIKKWYKMLTGKSILHVHQGVGSRFSLGELNGYFNDMTEKVTMLPELLDNDQLPANVVESGQKVYFPVAIFQYGLGAYDLYLSHQDEKYLRKFKQCVDWAIDKQEPSGAWNNFFFVYPDNPYGAMCQGEGASLLIRAFNLFHDEKYKHAAYKALDFMLKPIDQGGTAQYCGDELILMEYTHLPAVLNGWVFALFGLYDYCLNDNNDIFKNALNRTIASLKHKLPKYDCGYWSMYDLNGKIASPFYHDLHIAQMTVMSLITSDDGYNSYADCWLNYKNNFICSKLAFMKKVLQKVLE